MGDTTWHEVDATDLAVGEAKTVVAGGRGVCLARVERGLGALDNRCPHQGGPLGEGTIEDGWLICPWHGYEYDPTDRRTARRLRRMQRPPSRSEKRRCGRRWASLSSLASRSLMDQMVDVMVEWGVDSVFGMVGHSNLGLADALRAAEDEGRLTLLRHSA